MVLFSFGLLTFLRVVWRNKTIEQLDLEIHDLRKMIEHPDELAIPQDQKSDSTILASFTHNLNGSLTQLLYLTESLLAAAIIYVSGIVYHIPPCTFQFVLWTVPIILALLLYLCSDYVRNLKIEIWLPPNQSLKLLC
jgi:hypothetical protein